MSNPYAYIIRYLLAFSLLVCYPYLVIHITNRIIGVARNYTVVLTRLRRILRGYLHFMLVLLSVYGIFESE